MSDSNRVAVAAKVEVTPGTAPAGPYQAINISSTNLNAQKNTAEENTIRSDRNLRNTVMTSMVPQGGFGFDFIYGNLDTFIPGIMGSALGPAISLAAIAGTVTGAVFAATAGTPFSAVVVGQWLGIKIGTTKYVGKVTAIGGAGASITLAGVTLPSGAQTLASVKGQVVRNGTTMLTYTIEKQFADQATKGFFAFTGMVPNVLNLNAQAEQIVTGDLSFLGMNAPVPSDTSISGSAYTAAVTNESFAGLSGNIGQFMVGGSLILPTDVAIKGVSVAINTNARRDVAINVTNMGWGQFGVTGTLNTYFKGGLAAVDAFFTHADSSFSYVMTDPQGNICVVSCLNLKYTDFNPQVGGKNQAVMGDLQFAAKLDTATGASFQFDFITGL